MTQETTATRLRQLRLEKEVSQSDVARYLGIERASYSAYESGTSRPVRYMDKLALYFNVSTDYLLCLSDNPQPKKQGLNEEEKKLLDQYWLLNAEGRLALNLYIEFLISQENYTKKVASSVS